MANSYCFTSERLTDRGILSDVGPRPLMAVVLKRADDCFVINCRLCNDGMTNPNATTVKTYALYSRRRFTDNVTSTEAVPKATDLPATVRSLGTGQCFLMCTFIRKHQQMTRTTYCYAARKAITVRRRVQIFSSFLGITTTLQQFWPPLESYRLLSNFQLSALLKVPFCYYTPLLFFLGLF